MKFAKRLFLARLLHQGKVFRHIMKRLRSYSTLNDIAIDYYSRSPMKVYPNNSFDRFGDDLTELILSYLRFEDKVRLECLSKQWRRLVFNKQFVIEIKNEKTKNSMRRLIRRIIDIEKCVTERKDSLKQMIRSDNSVDAQVLELLVKKCPNITTIGFHSGMNSEVLSLIGRHCHHIRSLTVSIDSGKEEEVLNFGRQYGHKFKELDINAEAETIKQFLKLCPNLEKLRVSGIHMHQLGDISSEIKDICPKLENVVFNVQFQPRIQVIAKVLAENYSQNLKELVLWVAYLSHMMDRYMSHIFYICRLENLKQLDLVFEHMEINCEEGLSLIGQKCTKLVKLDLSVGIFKRRPVVISDRFFDVFSKFKAIKKLKIIFSQKQILFGSVECFKHCEKLTELDIKFVEIREDFFANIASFVPKLQSLRIDTYKPFSDSFIDSFHSMKNIQRVNLILITVNYELKTRKNDYKLLYYRKALSNLMSNPNRREVNRIADNCALIAYNNVNENNISYEF